MAGTGLVLRVGGALDPSLDAALAQSVARAKAAGVQAQNALRSDITRQQKIIGGLTSADAAEVIGRSQYVKQQTLKLRLTQAAQERAIIQSEVTARVAAEAEKVAAVKASNLAMMLAAAQGSGAGVSSGIGQHFATTGVVNESVVIMRELMMGRGPGRIAGSLTLLSTRAGLLGKIFKTSATESVVAAQAETKLSQAMAVTALAMEEKAAKSAAAAVAENLDAGASIRLAAADKLAAAAALENGLAQEAKAMKAVNAAKIALATAKVQWLPVAMVVGSIAAIAGAFYIFHRRVMSLAKDMIGPWREAFNPDHIAKYLQKTATLEQLQKNVTDEVRRTREAYDSVVSAMDRQLAITKDRISFERELLEIQKENELAAQKNPVLREGIEKKYSALILANKKEERDAELQHKKDIAAQLPGEINAAKSEISKLIGGNYFTDEHDRQILESRRASSAVYDEYRKQLKPGEKDKRDFSADKDRELISRLQAEEGRVSMDRDSLTGTYTTHHLSDEQKQRLADAQERLEKSATTQQSVNSWEDAKDDRDRARQQVKELEDKVTADEKRLAELGNSKQGDIADTARRNLAADKNDLRLEQERLKRVDAGHPLGAREVTARERVGLGAVGSNPMLNIAQAQLNVQRQTLAAIQNKGDQKPGTGTGQYAREHPSTLPGGGHF